ncbi:histidine-type phosphatase [Gilliamella sp. B2776]|uniref:histidine-type phosphatase n=1 Tax=unclassified Gilliamella TaxID=2685620 RepID=UPI002269F12A|nr:MULTISPECIES: histidine-type phosphatase [unclassified Gilliamella]MCX8650367.1 histidine-type phosphatase [Gilliamella sp. B2779]MCX8654660.1 histidine-type phosphatase [Gilliamella sp. B2737]MCX8656701.1 histidine-type phosphatase [Gilliamella sp. B2894]MCX8665297.1 histidine-type phosphatase [Gilliamella sp. B2887]MCX8692140.1 histidine-type phosphatase [Gilliamella sp. B2776]
MIILGSRKLLTVFLFTFTSLSFAQPYVIAGSKTAYPYDPKQILTSAPTGYQAFYIDHIGRHGSRYISKSKHEDLAYHILSLADSQHQLTNSGKDLLSQLIIIKQLNQNHYGQLTNLGRTDISLISRRMLENNPSVFKGQKIEVISTSSPRAKETAEIFIKSFKVKYPNIHVVQQPDNEQTLLRFFEYSPAYSEYKKSQTVKNAVKSIEYASRTEQMSKQVAKGIFKKSFLNKLKKGLEVSEDASVKTSDFVIAIYQLYQELQAFSPQVLTDNHLELDRYFSSEQKEWYNTVVTAKNYLQIGPAFNNTGIQIKIAAPLLWDMIHSADKAIKDNNVDANLRFAHAETISPLATLLEIEGSANVTKTLFDYPTVWKADKIIPMGANIQWLFYKSKQTHQPILIKVLLNEREVHLPVKSDIYPYYLWSDVKQFYVNKLNKLGLVENHSEIEMLKNLQ